MEILKEFLDKSIALCNKNNVIEIILGKVTSPSIFNTNIYTDHNLKTIIKNIKSHESKISISSKKMKRFYYGNSVIEAAIKSENQTTITHYSKNIFKCLTINDKRVDYQLQNIHYYNETTILTSPIFNYSEELEQLEIIINNSMSIIIEKSTGISIKIVIYKPINSEQIIDIIKLFPTSSFH
jgi:hypothetical protein